MEKGDTSNKNSKKTNNSSDILSKFKDIFKSDINKSLDNIEISLIRFATAILILLISYIAFSNIIVNQINKKEIEIEAFISDSKEQISEISNNTTIIKERTEQYNSMIEKINEANDKLTQSYAKKNVLPNFLTEIMFNIPKEVQLTSIENVSGKTIKMEAQSKEYEQLGYFIAKIKNEGILTDVTATSGQKQGQFIVITIEGNLPY